jgi:hypothetical protein
MVNTFSECLGGSAPLAELENDDIDQKVSKQRESTPPSSKWHRL